MSSNDLDFTYPDLSEALYGAKDLHEATDNYCKILRSTGILYHTQYAAKLERASRMLSPKNLESVRKDISEYRKYLSQWKKDKNLRILIKGRQKDFLGTNAKIRLFLETGKNLSKIQDLLGFRIVLQTGCVDTQESIQQLYNILNETIRFFSVERKCMLMEAEPRCGEEITSQGIEELNLVVPEESLITPGFENNIKDYVRFPKANGYQSLHILIERDVVFEVQLRTSAMDILAEYGTGRHAHYKQAKYQHISGIEEEIDFSKINMYGFKFLPDGDIYDTIGLQQSIDPFDIVY